MHDLSRLLQVCSTLCCYRKTLVFSIQFYETVYLLSADLIEFISGVWYVITSKYVLFIILMRVGSVRGQREAVVRGGAQARGGPGARRRHARRHAVRRHHHHSAQRHEPECRPCKYKRRLN